MFYSILVSLGSFYERRDRFRASEEFGEKSGYPVEIMLVPPSIHIEKTVWTFPQTTTHLHPTNAVITRDTSRLREVQ